MTMSRCGAIGGFGTVLMVSALLFTGASYADSYQKELEKADPLTRSTWVCETLGLKDIKASKPADNPDPDRLFLGPTTHSPQNKTVNPELNGTELKGGGMFRGDKGWTNISFTCETSADHMEAKTFSFELKDTESWGEMSN